MADNRLSISNVRCSYFDSAVLGNVKKTATRIYKIFEIAYYLEDGGSFTRNGSPCRIRKDHLRICVPGREGGGNILPFKIICLKFEADGMLAERIASIPTYFQVRRTELIKEAMHELDILCHAITRNELLIYSKTIALLDLVIEEAKEPKELYSQKQRIIDQAKKYMKDNYQRAIKLDDIAQEVHLCPTYFHTLFTQTCGITPHDYLLEYRIRTAKEYLLTTSDTLCEIAERCGFCNQQYMATVFKAKTGQTPAQYRREYQMEYLE